MMEKQIINIDNSFFDGVDMGAIARRYSCRGYDANKKISEEQIRQINAFTERLNKFSSDIVFHFRSIGADDKTPLKSVFFVPIYKNACGFACIEIKSSPEKNRPNVDILVGILGEIFVLYLYSIGVANVWLGGAGFCFSPKRCAEILGLKDSESAFPICFAMGIPKNPLTEIDSRKRRSPKKILDPTFDLDSCGGKTDGIATIDDVNVNKELSAFLQTIQAAPSALNRQPYNIAFSKTKGKIAFIAPNHDYKVGGAYMSKWLDCGIAAAHFYVYHLQGKSCPDAQIIAYIKPNALVLECTKKATTATDIEKDINAN